jgi:hypothetical protein
VVAINIQELPPHVQVDVEKYRELHQTKAVYVHQWGNKYILKTFPKNIIGMEPEMTAYEDYLLETNYKLVLGTNYKEDVIAIATAMSNHAK